MRNYFTPTVFVSALLMLTACGGSSDAPTKETGDPAPAAKEVAVSDPTTASPEPTSSVVERQKPDKGRIVFLRCRSCHTLKEGEAHLTGPNLHAMFKAKAGTKKDYAYSDALSKSDIVWSAETLDAWLQRPQDFIEGNNMVFAGLPKKADRDALIEYLMRETQ